jgi:hypothetical protein
VADALEMGISAAVQAYLKVLARSCVPGHHGA